MKLVGRLDHPNVVRAFDADQIHKVLYIVMEYVPGKSLGQLLKKGPIPPVEMFEYGAQAALGLAHAHEQGMVHRDIKPSNILLTDDRKVKILDLGLGVLMEADSQATFATADGIAVGTVDYMSPEQALGREIDGRSDIFSLGCAMFHLMTGKLAFPGESPIDRLGRRINSKPAAISDHIPDFPAVASRVLDKMMALKPQDRFASALETAEALQNVLRPKVRSAPANRSSTSVRELSGRQKDLSPAEASTASKPSTQLPTPSHPLVDAKSTSLRHPRWFAPLAQAVERWPVGALFGVVVALAVVFGAGFAAGHWLR
jgi:serine/threonine-protein kinase